jgi:3-O-methylgallate 3,4-dioxygenase
MPRGPQLRLPADRWAEIGERDKSSPWLFDDNGQRLTYDQLLARSGAAVLDEITPRKWEERYQAAQAAWSQVRHVLDQARPDVVLVMGDDENEHFKDDATRPKLAVYRGSDWTWGDPATSYPVAVELTDHVSERLRSAGYAPLILDSLPAGERMPHSFGNTYTELMETVCPIVPIMVNIHYPVNQTTPVESYRLGQVLRSAVESWGGDLRVAVTGNGGLSTGVLREDFDRRLLEVLSTRDIDALAALPYRWIQGPSGEIYNWIGAAGALEGLEMRVAAYIPAYRSPAATGCGMTFATWS